MSQDDVTTDKRHMLRGESLDPGSMLCVNPYEVNPLSDSLSIPCATLTADIPLKVEPSVSGRNQDAINCGGFYGSQKKIKLEMEEFGDLSPFVSQKRNYTNSIDELNTPIFDKDDFDFDISNYEQNVHADLHVMLKYDTSIYKSGAQAVSATYYPPQDYNTKQDIFLNNDSISRNITILPLENTRNDDALIYSPTASENGTYVENLSPNAYKVYECDINDSVSVNVDSRNPSPYGQITPDGSEMSYNQSPDYKTSHTSDSHMKSLQERKTRGPVGHKLSLDINLGNLVNQNTVLDVSTPALIAEVVNLESTGFNILDLINEDTPLSTDIFSPNVSQNQTNTKVQSERRIAVKQPRKRRHYDEDDEDYVPPSKKYSATYKKSGKVIQEYASSESESEEEKPRKKARGRPPKRKESVSSDCSLGRDSDVSRYRELRDKNNEASRKSRLKRRVKELELEKESEELNSKNIKLKAQVEELEKIVNNFRDNLFKIMINK